jgi:hypothetical protein
MTKRAAMVCLLAGLSSPRGWGDEDRRATPTYTNEDLDRMAPRRGETGVLSKPASREDSRMAPERKARGEAYWRREVERLRTRLRPLRERAAQLRERLQELRTDPGQEPPRRGSRKASAEALARRLDSLEAEIRDREDELHERARRERALPGWLR